ncbi:chromosome segregation protein SMC [Ectopseudomonas composti]|uniref:Chromosome segregation protein SMC n=1 Tax=Ectopseudomonas composti TaxID=658457 RepID=A0ABN0S6L7_9GAMM|nr:AAA family ATPase [Pseudomonas composti]EZH77243.1 chromosome segregation protein SMC [Pseudomonas composti]
MIKLKKLTIKNFKVFGEEPYSINFKEDNLVILDGPNGYGKTSVFDALELALTGTISRLSPSDGRQNPSDNVVAHNGAKEIEVTLELSEDGKPDFIIKRVLKANTPKDANKISKFSELWDSYVFLDEHWKQISSNEIGNLLKNDRFSKDFLLFHYIQQEETSVFLKSKSESQRADELSQLFGNTRIAEQKYQKLVVFQRQAEKLRKDAVSRAAELKKIYSLEGAIISPKFELQPHFYLLPHLAESNFPEWDKAEIITLNQEKLNAFSRELAQLQKFALHAPYYLRQRAYKRYSQQNEVITLFIASFNSLLKTDEVENKFSVTRSLTSAFGIFDSKDLRGARRIDLYQLFSLLDFQGETPSFIETLNQVLSEEDKLAGLTSITYKMVEQHTELAQSIRSHPDKKDCPLCGQSYDSHDILNSHINTTGEHLKSLLGTQEQAYRILRDDFVSTTWTKVLTAIKDNLDSNSFSQTGFEYFKQAKSIENRLNAFHAWLSKEKIEFNDLLLPDLTEKSLAKLDSNSEILRIRISDTAGIPSDQFQQDNSDNSFDRLFSDYFNNDPKLIPINLRSLAKEKSQWLSDLHFNSLSGVFQDIMRLEKNSEIYARSSTSINKIASQIRKQIRRYRKKLITDIEIPFYIYSGKILQTHQAGLGQGALIKDYTDSEELKNVKLVSNWKSDHDILNTMSSGQISAVVIALSMALNKVYSKKFSTILIDDPVQTMDDINMSSFVELLRNEFPDRQIILSTHEEKVSRYFTYKFLKHKKNVRRINMMDRTEYIPRGFIEG